MDVDQIADAVVRKMKEEKHALWLDPETHAEQHEWLRMLMEDRASKLKRRQALQDKIAGSLILGAVLMLVGLIGAGTISWVKEHLK